MRHEKYFSFKNLTFLIIIIALIFFPYVADSRTLTILMTQIFIFSILAMSYDILLGYTGIVSFGHAMFFGIGAYTTAILLSTYNNTMMIFLISIIVGMIFAGIVSFLVGLLTLRLKSHFFAMLTLAISGLFLVVAEKWRTVTKGNDGFTFRAPDVFRDRVIFYFFVLVCLVVVFLVLRRFVNSPLGKVLIAVRENEQRTRSLGFRTLHYKVTASVVAGVVASLSGSLYAISLRFVNTSVMSMDITLDALLMTIIGGVGTLIGPIVGSLVIETAQHYLSGLANDYPIFERWIIFFGMLYILAVIFFPKGIVGTVYVKYLTWKSKKAKPQLPTQSVPLVKDKERFE
ncbi:branched-chain amino acid ABC transporter permease [Viridibacillus sp. FSL R5-0477]|uniref:ABC transporter permease n=1 Tax=Viridibacillus arenosi FSL R5-213 TaxID=1227360 RepID=W4EK94_9BACL|nr:MULTISPECIES: branched-chain amino acid ABC transporter permease [Viridibacillus]ETT80960.1 ABC transporter permease [Viridibacillus arenosi FSL R5-213]OMC88443.1 branched-chain amino acid ABC transporter permease [Viridibacillus sp. FSL H7-0596]OMC93081.1 branched-chain amino acid ABC transporter permease [Viridibacillus arenosi]